MSFRRLVIAASILTSAFSPALHLDAQAGPIASIAFGSLGESGGNWRNTRHLTLDVIAGVRTRYEEPRGLIFGAYGGATNKLFGTDAKTCVTSTGTECLPAFPQFKYVGLLAGGETRSERFGVTVVGGPGAFISARTRVARDGTNGAYQFSTQDGGRHIGWLARADITYFLDQDFGILLGVSTRMIPNFADERLMLSGVSLGLRIR